MTWSVKPLPASKRRTLSTKQHKLHNFKLGATGENQAAHFLRLKNFKLLEKNRLVGKNEIDIIAFDTSSSELTFIEVKTRTRLPLDISRLISPTQKHNLRKATLRYVAEKKYRGCYRIDLICITPHAIEHYISITA